MSSFSSRSLKGVLLAILVVDFIDLATSDCAPPQTPDHASLRYETQHASPPRRLRNGYLVRVVCDDLFRLAEGDGFMTCSNGEWSQTFNCTPICDPLASFPRGEITYTGGGTIARYSCTVPGYRLDGTRKRRCSTDGTWTGEQPRCKGIPRCEQPELEEHVIQQRVSGRKREQLWIVGSILSFSCEGSLTFTSGQFSAIECTRRGWNDSVPICTEGKCKPLLDTIENGNSSAENRTYFPGEAITFTCNYGYRTNSPSWRTCVARRGEGGSFISRWEGVTPQCIETRCTEPRQIENGVTIKFSNAINGIVRFRCQSGFDLIGESVISCKENGQWNGTIPICDNNQNDCPALAAPLNGYKHGDRYSRYDIIEFSCNSGYTLYGSRERECLFDGQWSGEEAKCIGSLDFDDINQISAVLGQNLDRLAVQNLFENEVEEIASNGSSIGRFIPSYHKYGVDLFFLFDASDSVGVERFELAKKFARELVRKIGVTSDHNSLRVGALTFAHNAEISFLSLAFKTTEEVIEEGINKIKFKGGGTNMAEGLRLALEVLVPTSQRRAGSYKTVFLITDGAANEGGSPVPFARSLEQEGVKVHCLGLGEDAGRQQLLSIGSQPHSEHVFFFKDYSDLTALVSKVVNQSVDYSPCGISQKTVSRGRVVGGNDANPGAWPWQVYLEMRKGLQKLKCGGVLIDRNWVLTAAHCIPSADYTMKVVLGVTNLEENRGRKEIDVAERIIHREFNGTTLQNDIALLRLATPAHLHTNVRTICLPDPDEARRLIPANPTRRHVATLTGWGHNEFLAVGNEFHADGGGVNELQQLALPMKSREDCRTSLQGKKELPYFDESMFCVGFINAQRGACRGDSGGPLVRKVLRDGEQRWTLIGLTSWGRGCAVRNELDFFTNVPYFIDWIIEKINPPQEKVEAGEGEEGEEEEDNIGEGQQ